MAADTTASNDEGAFVHKSEIALTEKTGNEMEAFNVIPHKSGTQGQLVLPAAIAASPVGGWPTGGRAGSRRPSWTAAPI